MPVSATTPIPAYAPKFGILVGGKTSLTSIMIISQFAVTEQDEFVESLHANGSVSAVQQIDKPRSFSCRGILTNNAPLSGAILKIDGLEWQVRTSRIIEESSSFRMVEIEGIQKTW